MKQLIKIRAKFSFEAARSNGIDDYQSGPVPFVSSTVLNNGVVGYVTPMLGDKIFDRGPVLCISGLGDATVQTGKFLPKGNGGDSMTIGTPLEPMTVQELVAAAAAFNTLHAWRFSFGRKASKSRVEDLEIPLTLPTIRDIWAGEKTRAVGIAQSVADL